MINGVCRVFPVILDDNETTVGRASNVQKRSHNIQSAVGASSNTSGSIHSSSQAYAEYQESIPESEQRHFEYAWCEQMSSDYLQFYNWYSLTTGATFSKVSQITT